MNKKVILTLAIATGVSGALVTQVSAKDPAAVPTDPVAAPSAPTAEKKATFAQIEKAITDFSVVEKAFVEKLQAEPDRNKQRAMYENERPQPDEEIALILSTAKENPKTENLDQALAWSLRYISNPERRLVVENYLLTHHKGSETLGMLAQMSASHPQGAATLRKIIEVSTHEKVRQGSTYFLASKLIASEADRAEGLKTMKSLLATEGLAESNPGLFKAAQSELFVAENLSIGATAPDIIGTDHDDKEFKLSDYRGKVILLDFWGIW